MAARSGRSNGLPSFLVNADAADALSAELADLAGRVKADAQESDTSRVTAARVRRIERWAHEAARFASAQSDGDGEVHLR